MKSPDSSYFTGEFQQMFKEQTPILHNFFQNREEPETFEWVSQLDVRLVTFF